MSIQCTYMIVVYTQECKCYSHSGNCIEFMSIVNNENGTLLDERLNHLKGMTITQIGRTNMRY